MGVVGYKASNKNDNNADFANSTSPRILVHIMYTRKVRRYKTLERKLPNSCFFLLQEPALSYLIG